MHHLFCPPSQQVVQCSHGKARAIIRKRAHFVSRWSSSNNKSAGFLPNRRQTNERNEQQSSSSALPWSLSVIIPTDNEVAKPKPSRAKITGRETLNVTSMLPVDHHVQSVSPQEGIHMLYTSCHLRRQQQQRLDRLRDLVGDLGVTLFAPLELILDDAGNDVDVDDFKKMTSSSCTSSSFLGPAIHPHGAIHPPTLVLIPPYEDGNDAELRRGEHTLNECDCLDASGRNPPSPHQILSSSCLSEESSTDMKSNNCSSSSSCNSLAATTSTTDPEDEFEVGGGDDSSSSHIAAASEDVGCYGWIDPEPLGDLESCPRILTDTLLQELVANHLPLSCQSQRLTRCFSLGLHGDSILSLLRQCQLFTKTILVILTTQGQILGGFCTETWNIQRHQRRQYFGTGESFLFASHPDCIEGVDKGVPSGQNLAVYPWSGINDYCQICDPEANRIAMGGEGEFGLIVQDNFAFGKTGRSRTFRNPSLVSGGACVGHFEIAALEVYGLVPFGFLSPSPP